LLNDQEYGAIVAHVIAHQALGHDTKLVTAEYVRKRGRSTPDPDPNRAAVEVADIITELMTSKRYSAEDEAAADAFAAELMAKSAVDPMAAVEAWRKVQRLGNTRAPTIGALHEVDAQRLAAIEAKSREWVPVYQKSLASRRLQGPAPPMPRR
jgi:predicted Zn-dependent protease